MKTYRSAYEILGEEYSDRIKTMLDKVGLDLPLPDRMAIVYKLICQETLREQGLWV